MENHPEPTLVELIRYNNWANAQIFAICQKLTADQIATSALGTYGTIHRTLGHMIAAEADYIGRITGDRPQPPFKWEDGPALADIATFAPRVADALLDVVQRTPPTQWCMRRKTAYSSTMRLGICLCRRLTMASSIAPTSPPFSPASVSHCQRWMAGAISLPTQIGLS
ncbi:MAG: hypothetical protein HC853_17710 [Anaerolineae bacterium]|nr:hypothetical protein [Anaerolineae bacterium]